VVTTAINTPYELTKIHKPQTTRSLASIMVSVPLLFPNNINYCACKKVPCLYDNNQRSENENVRIQNLWEGIEMYAAVMTMR